MTELLESLTRTMHRMHWYEFAAVAVIGVVVLCAFGVVAVEIGGAVWRLVRRKAAEAGTAAPD